MLSSVVSILLSSKWLKGAIAMAAIAIPIAWKYFSLLHEIQTKNDTIVRLEQEIKKVKQDADLAIFNAQVACMEPREEEKDENITVDLGDDLYF